MISFQIVWMMRDFVGPVPEVQQQQKSQREQGHYREYIVKMQPTLRFCREVSQNTLWNVKFCTCQQASVDMIKQPHRARKQVQLTTA